MRVVSDNEKCIGCLACVVACADHHSSADEPIALRLYERAQKSAGYTSYATFSCHHCEDAECVSVCPAGAISRNEDGLVLVDGELCIGCQACAAACPFDIPRFDKEGKMIKCDGCLGDPACVKICPQGALSVI